MKQYEHPLRFFRGSLSRGDLIIARTRSRDSKMERRGKGAEKMTAAGGRSVSMGMGMKRTPDAPATPKMSSGGRDVQLSDRLLFFASSISLHVVFFPRASISCIYVTMHIHFNGHSCMPFYYSAAKLIAAIMELIFTGGESN